MSDFTNSLAGDTNDVAGKTVFIYGNRKYPAANRFAELLEQQGVCTRFTANPPDETYGFPAQSTDAVIDEITALRPDAVVILWPMMDLHVGDGFRDQPSLKLARATKKLSIPTMIADAIAVGGSLQGPQAAAVSESGATLLSGLLAPRKLAEGLIAQLQKNHGGPGSPGVS